MRKFLLADLIKATVHVRIPALFNTVSLSVLSSLILLEKFTHTWKKTGIKKNDRLYHVVHKILGNEFF